MNREDRKRNGKVMTRRDGKWNEATCKGFALSGWNGNGKEKQGAAPTGIEKE